MTGDEVVNYKDGRGLLLYFKIIRTNIQCARCSRACVYYSISTTTLGIRSGYSHVSEEETKDQRG